MNGQTLTYYNRATSEQDIGLDRRIVFSHENLNILQHFKKKKQVKILQNKQRNGDPKDNDVFLTVFISYRHWKMNNAKT